MGAPSFERTALYHLYDDGGQLLYIGIATNPERRWLQHAAEKDWWSAVTRRDTRWFDTRTEAASYEASAVQAERPLYNLQHNGERELREVRTKRYREIADALRGQILAGTISPGEKLPSENTLMEQCEAARSTVRQALSVLRDEGLTNSRQGEGVRARRIEDRTIKIPTGRPQEAAELVRRALTREDLAAFLAHLIT